MEFVSAEQCMSDSLHVDAIASGKHIGERAAGSAYGHGEECAEKQRGSEHRRADACYATVRLDLAALVHCWIPSLLTF